MNYGPPRAPEMTRNWTLGALLAHQKRLVKKFGSELPSYAVNGPYVFFSNIFWRWRTKSPQHRWIMSIDFHPSVVADFQSLTSRQGTRIYSRVLSFHNRNFRKIFRFPDPTRGVSFKNWRRFTQQDVDKFQKVYSPLLNRMDAFLVTYPTSFIRLYANLKQPIIVVNPIRYEHPFSNRPTEWKQLDDEITSGVKSGRIVFIANNRADAEYVSRQLRIEVPVVPSLCDYTGFNWKGPGDLSLTYAHYTDIGQEFEKISGGAWKNFRSIMGKKFDWQKFGKVREVFYVPYAPSTMFLFELATAGVPVAVPSLSFISRLREKHPGVFSQLTFTQMAGKLPPSDRLWAANDHTNWARFSQWWFERSDFADPNLMPNVRIVDSFDELLSSPSVAESLGLEAYRTMVANRNRLLSQAVQRQLRTSIRFA